MKLERLGVILAAFCAGCGGEGDDRAPLMGDADGSTPVAPTDLGPTAAPGPCRDGDIERCTVRAPEHLDINSCAVGVTVCANGTWGPCERADRVDGGAELFDTADGG